MNQPHQPVFLDPFSGKQCALAYPARVREAIGRLDWNAPDVGMIDLARAFKVSVPIPYYWLRQGYLPPVYAARGRARWASADMRAYLESLLTAEPRVAKGGGR